MMFGASRRRVPTQDATVGPDDAETDDEHNCENDPGNDEAELEPWPEFLIRVTDDIETRMTSFCLEDWVLVHRRRKWRLAGKIARCSDMRWSKRLLTWRPWFPAGRGVGRPHVRWGDCIESFAGGNWRSHAADKNLGSFLEEGYATSGEIMETTAGPSVIGDVDGICPSIL